jgi:hypothetical protein
MSAFGEGDDDQTATVDLSVAFFAAILMLLAFVTFSLTDLPDDPPRASLGQTEIVQTAIPPTWSPVLRRGGWAVLTQERLVLLDLDPILAQIAEGRNSTTTENGGVSWRRVSSSASPRSFQLDLGLVVSALPPSWAGATVDFENDDGAVCGEFPPLLTVLLPHDLPDITPFLSFAAACNISYKFQILSEPREGTGVTRLRIGLSPQSYAREQIFR